MLGLEGRDVSREAAMGVRDVGGFPERRERNGVFSSAPWTCVAS